MKWLGLPPVDCNICNKRIAEVFVDGKLKSRSTWCFMCLSCHKSQGEGLGLGKGQKYRKKDGYWEKQK